MPNELKPCKCGCEAELIEFQTFEWCDIYWRVRCTNEYCTEQTHRCDSKTDAINAWNRRANDEQR